MTVRRRGVRLKIGALEREAGVTRDAIHHYVRLGLLPRPEKTGATVAYYDDRHVERLRRIRALRAHGLSLPLIGRLLEAGGDRASPKDLEAVGRLLAPGDRSEAAPVEPPSEAAHGLAMDLGFPVGAVIADARLVAALETVVTLPAVGRALAAESAGVLVAHARGVATAERRLAGAWLAQADDGPAAVATLREVKAALRELSVAVRDHLQRAETERGFQEIVEAAERATRARWLPAGSSAGAGGVALLATLDARVARGDDPAAHHARVRLLYGVGPARRLGEATKAARSEGVDGPWVALGAGVARLDAGDLAGAREEFSLALGHRPGWALAVVYNAASTLLSAGRGEGALVNDALAAVRSLDGAWPTTTEPAVDRMWTLLVKAQTLLGLPGVLGRADAARAICEDLVVAATGIRADDPTRSTGELARLEGNAWLSLAAARRATGDPAGERAALARAAAMAGPVAHAARARLRAVETPQGEETD